MRPLEEEVEADPVDVSLKRLDFRCNGTKYRLLLLLLLLLLLSSLEVVYIIRGVILLQEVVVEVDVIRTGGS